MLPKLQTVCDAVRPCALVLHGTAAVRFGRAFLFLAHSGGGKSTLAALCDSKGIPVLGDDSALVLESDTGFHIRPLPRQARLPASQTPLGEQTRLHRIFFLEKAENPSADPISPIKGASYCLKDGGVFGYRNWAPSDRWLALDRLIRLFRAVPAYVLHFAKDDRFWEVVDGLEVREKSVQART